MDTNVALMDFSRHYRRTLIITPIIGGIGLLVSSLFGHPVAGGTFCVGLVLGLLNSRLMVGATARFTGDEGASKRRFAFGSLQRLAAISVVAVVLAYALRPDGLAVFAGLALFQLIVVGGAAGPLLREVRGGGGDDL